MNINLTRGFFRAWLVFSVVWIVVSIWLCISDVSSKLRSIDALENGPIVKSARLLLPGEYDARTKAPLDNRVSATVTGKGDLDTVTDGPWMDYRKPAATTGGNLWESAPIVGQSKSGMFDDLIPKPSPSVADDIAILRIAGTNVLVDKSFTNESEVDQHETVLVIAEKLGIAMQVKPRVIRIWSDKISSTAPWAIGVPLMLLILGAATRWIFLGFKTVP